MAFGAIGVCGACGVGCVWLLPRAAEGFGGWDCIGLIVKPAVPFRGDGAGLWCAFIHDPAAGAFVAFARRGSVVGVSERICADFCFLF